MKKIIIGLLILCCFKPIMAQEKGTSELSLGYGLASSTQLMYDISDIFIIILTLGTAEFENEKSTEAIHLGYKYSIGERFSLGAVFAYEQITNDLKSGKDLIGKSINTFYTIAIESDIRYVSKEYFQMYSGLGLGYTAGMQDFTSSDPSVSDSDDNVHLFNFQVTALGVRAGKSFGGFAEIGLGYKGIFNFGISYQF